MDGDDLGSEPSQPITLTEFFMAMFPSYMVMGMSYEEYWEGPVWLAKAYREAYEIRQKREEWARHRQATYIFKALLCAAPVLKPFVKDAKPGEFPERPWPLTQKEADEQATARERENYKKALARRRAASDAEIKRRKEEAAKKQEVIEYGD